MQFVDGIHLARSQENADEIAALATRTGQRVGVSGVMADLNREATQKDVPGSAADWGFTWNQQDNESDLWWPQGISTSADA
ncbi:MAG: hypothetical protein WA880_06150, partial [Ornithinimicrobium sp.]